MAAAAAATVFKLLVVAFTVMVARVAAETYHVSGGQDFDATAWLSDRLFTVGDQIWMENLGSDEKMVEVGRAEELESCDVSNPMGVIGEAVALEEEGIRYFTSSDPESCLNGLKLPVTVHRRRHDFYPDAPSPYEPDVPPYEPDVPYPPRRPDVHHPPPPAAAASATAALPVFWFVLSFYYLAI